MCNTLVSTHFCPNAEATGHDFVPEDKNKNKNTSGMSHSSRKKVEEQNFTFGRKQFFMLGHDHQQVYIKVPFAEGQRARMSPSQPKGRKPRDKALNLDDDLGILEY